MSHRRDEYRPTGNGNHQQPADRHSADLLDPPWNGDRSNSHRADPTHGDRGGLDGVAAGLSHHAYWQMVMAFRRGELADVPALTDAGVWDALLGGWRCVAADDRLARYLAGREPRLVACTRAHSRFAGRAMQWLVNHGIRQFIDLGCGIGDSTAHLDPPTRHNTHPGIRLGLVDVHPLVVARLRDRHRDDRHVAVIEADLRRPGGLLTDEALHELIDFGEPVAFLAIAVLQCLTDSDVVALIRQIRDTVVTGSYLVISHPGLTHAGLPATADTALATAYAHYPADWASRGRGEIHTALDGGWTPTPPGITHVAQWRPDPDTDPPHHQNHEHKRGDERGDGLGWAVTAVATDLHPRRPAGAGLDGRAEQAGNRQPPSPPANSRGQFDKVSVHTTFRCGSDEVCVGAGSSVLCGAWAR